MHPSKAIKQDPHWLHSLEWKPKDDFSTKSEQRAAKPEETSYPCFWRYDIEARRTIPLGHHMLARFTQIMESTGKRFEVKAVVHLGRAWACVEVESNQLLGLIVMERETRSLHMYMPFDACPSEADSPHDWIAPNWRMPVFLVETKEEEDVGGGGKRDKSVEESKQSSFFHEALKDVLKDDEPRAEDPPKKEVSVRRPQQCILFEPAFQQSVMEHILEDWKPKKTRRFEVETRQWHFCIAPNSGHISAIISVSPATDSSPLMRVSAYDLGDDDAKSLEEDWLLVSKVAVPGLYFHLVKMKSNETFVLAHEFDADDDDDSSSSSSLLMMGIDPDRVSVIQTLLEALEKPVDCMEVRLLLDGRAPPEVIKRIANHFQVMSSAGDLIRMDLSATFTTTATPKEHTEFLRQEREFLEQNPNTPGRVMSPTLYLFLTRIARSHAPASDRMSLFARSRWLAEPAFVSFAMDDPRALPAEAIRDLLFPRSVSWKHPTTLMSSAEESDGLVHPMPGNGVLLSTQLLHAAYVHSVLLKGSECAPSRPEYCCCSNLWILSQVGRFFGAKVVHDGMARFRPPPPPPLPPHAPPLLMIEAPKCKHIDPFSLAWPLVKQRFLTCTKAVADGGGGGSSGCGADSSIVTYPPRIPLRAAVYDCVHQLKEEKEEDIWMASCMAPCSPWFITPRMCTADQVNLQSHSICYVRKTMNEFQFGKLYSFETPSASFTIVSNLLPANVLALVDRRTQTLWITPATDASSSSSAVGFCFSYPTPRPAHDMSLKQQAVAREGPVDPKLRERLLRELGTLPLHRLRQVFTVLSASASECKDAFERLAASPQEMHRTLAFFLACQARDIPVRLVYFGSASRVSLEIQTASGDWFLVPTASEERGMQKAGRIILPPGHASWFVQSIDHLLSI